MLRGNRSSKGFTLLEVIITLAIFAIIVLPIVGNVMKAAEINKASENKQKAILLAQEIMEELKSMPFSEIKEYKKEEGYTLEKPSFDSYRLQGINGDFEITIAFSPEDKYRIPESVGIKPDNVYIIEVYRNGNTDSIKLQNNTSINLLNKEINIVSEETKTKVQGQELEEQARGKDIKFVFSGDLSGKFTINAENKSSLPLKLYLYKNEASQATISVNNQGGTIKTYNNLFESDGDKSSSRIYNINIDIEYKDKLLYELSGNKTVER